MGKERVISQIGDSTDGENYEDDDDNISTLFKEYGEYHVSYILKDIGNKLLQSSAVRTKYTKIKKTFIEGLTSQERRDLKSLDEELGYCWGIIVNKYDGDKRKVLADGANSYFELNKQKIEIACRQDTDYQNLDNAADKANYYLRVKVNIQSKLQDIYKFNKKMEKHAQSQRVAIEPSFSTNHSKDASMFLAKIKASKKLDKDLGKNLLYDYKFGTHNTIGNYSIAKKTTQQNEIFEVKTAGGFLHYVTDEGTYNDIGKELKSFIDEKFINIRELKNFLQFALKGGIHSAIITNHNSFNVLIDRLQTLVKLVFGVEVKRNASALLTHAMFFDLVDAEKYNIAQIAGKIPMAIASAVSASVTIDRKIKEMDGLLPQQKLTLEYDYRTKIEAPKARELLKKDQQILQDWLKLKVNISDEIKKLYADNLLKMFGKNDKIAKFKEVILPTDLSFNFIKYEKCSQNANIDGAKIPFELDKYKGTLIFKWDDIKGQYKFKVSEIQEVSVKVFQDLIKEWYGIELPVLKGTKFIILKAAAEPRDSTPDQEDDNGSFKLPTTDKNEVSEITETISKIRLSEYKQKYVLNHSKLKSSLDGIDSNKTITDKIYEAITKALYHHITTSEKLMNYLGEKFILCNVNKSSKETMSTLKAIYLGLVQSKEFIYSNRLHLKDPNKHLIKSNVLSVDDLFCGVLDRVNKSAQENHREDILTTMKEYYEPQEQVSIVGEVAIL